MIYGNLLLEGEGSNFGDRKVKELITGERFVSAFIIDTLFLPSFESSERIICKYNNNTIFLLYYDCSVERDHKPYLSP